MRPLRFTYLLNPTAPKGAGRRAVRVKFNVVEHGYHTVRGVKSQPTDL